MSPLTARWVAGVRREAHAEADVGQVLCAEAPDPRPCGVERGRVVVVGGLVAVDEQSVLLHALTSDGFRQSLYVPSRAHALPIVRAIAQQWPDLFQGGGA